MPTAEAAHSGKYLIMGCTIDDEPSVSTWTIDDNTGEITYGRPDYDLYESERPVEASGNQPPSSQDICDSATELWRNINASTGDAALEIRTEVIKTQLAHACFR